VSDQGKVAEIGSCVHFHGLSPSAGLREECDGPKEDQDRVQASPTSPAKLLMLTQGLGRLKGS